MNQYVEGKIHVLSEYFHAQSEQNQMEMIKRATTRNILNILNPLHKRKYCEAIATFLVEKNFYGKIGIKTYEQLVDEVERFFYEQAEKNKITNLPKKTKTGGVFRA